RPHRRQAAKMFATRESVSALHALGFRGREQHRDVVTRFGMSGGEDLTSSGVPQDPFERCIPATPKVGGHAHPVEVHVQSQGGGRRVVGQPALLLAYFGQSQSLTTELRRYG